MKPRTLTHMEAVVLATVVVMEAEGVLRNPRIRILHAPMKESDENSLTVLV